jgi:3-deoxy-D-manno-octulosonic-acid transferase
MGELPLFYAAADVAFVGGSLVRHGGHNMLEPAALGVPVVSGPHVFNFVEICELLQQAGACVKVEDVDGLSDTLSLWLEDANERHRVGQRGRATVEKNRGALQSVMAMIDRHL